jgi:ATP-dependent RNA helicase DHX29
VHPFALLLFGGHVVVKHTERLVIVDEWMRINMSAQTGVMLREIRKQLDVLLQKMIERANTKEVRELDGVVLDGIISILSAS